MSTRVRVIHRIPHRIHPPVQAHRTIIIPRPGIARDESSRARVHAARPQVLQAGGVGPFSGKTIIACTRAKAADHRAVRGIVLTEDDRTGGIGQLAHGSQGVAELVGPGRVHDQ